MGEPDRRAYVLIGFILLMLFLTVVQLRSRPSVERVRLRLRKVNFEIVIDDVLPGSVQSALCRGGI
jgi:hypothetical protein